MAAGQSQWFYSGVVWESLTGIIPIPVRLLRSCVVRGPVLTEGDWHIKHQWPSFKFDPLAAKCPGSGTEVIPGKNSDTKIKPLPLTNGHGLYMTVTPERTVFSVGGMAITYDRYRYKFVTVLLPKRLRNGCFTSKTAVRRF